jgi:hypothetical protein
LPEIPFALNPEHTYRTGSDGWKLCSSATDEGDHFLLNDPKAHHYNAPTLFRYQEAGITEHSERFEPYGLIAKTRFKTNLAAGCPNCNKWLLCGAAFAIPMHLQGPGFLYLVDRGVSLELVEIDLGCPGLVCVASAEGLQTDLGVSKWFRTRLSSKEYLGSTLLGFRKGVCSGLAQGFVAGH